MEVSGEDESSDASDLESSRETDLFIRPKDKRPDRTNKPQNGAIGTVNNSSLFHKNEEQKDPSGIEDVNDSNGGLVEVVVESEPERENVQTNPKGTVNDLKFQTLVGD